MVSHHLAKFGGHRLCGSSRDMRYNSLNDLARPHD